jgi:hypothetical protein
MPRFTIRNMIMATAWLCAWCFILVFAHSRLSSGGRLPVVMVVPMGIIIVAGPTLFMALLTSQLSRGVRAMLAIAALWAFTVGGAFAILALVR